MGILVLLRSIHILCTIAISIFQSSMFHICSKVCEDTVISWTLIRNIYDIDRRSKIGRALTTLIDRHIKPNSFQKMSVHLAAQMFRHSTTASIRTAIECKQMPEDAKYTACFINKIDKLFDALNCKYAFSKKL